MGQMGQMSQMNPMMNQMGAAALPDQGSPAIDMSSWAAIPDPAAEGSSLQEGSSEQAQAIQDAVAATQHAQYMQQVQFLQQVNAHAMKEHQKLDGAGLVQPKTRFVDDYRAFKLCRFFSRGECMQGRRCIYAHCFEELHPASPDMPEQQETDSSNSFALAETTQTAKEQDSAPNMRLSKKRDLCRKFQDTGSCSRGSVCPNAHGEAELGKLGFVIYDKVKLKICMAWEKGKCSYGDKCFNAHGDHEIGQKRREFIEGPPMKKRAEGQSLEDYRREILRDPDAPPFPL